MNYNIIHKDGNAYNIIKEVSIHNFQNKDGSIHQQVLGMYVHELDCDRVIPSIYEAVHLIKRLT